MVKLTKNRRLKTTKKSQTKRLRKTPKKTIIVGKIYADWCKYCQILKPEWEKMKTKLRQNTGRGLKNVEFDIIEIGDTSENQMRNITIEQLLEDFNAKHFPGSENGVKANGYPTIFRICKKKIEYYNDEKDSKKLYKWFTRKC
jgi:thiol-disulfide isomerase/thioredoxin